MGRGAGAFIEKELFSAKEYALICSPWITFDFAKKIIRLVEKGTEVRVITSNSKAGDTDKTLEWFRDYVRPEKDLLGRIKKDWSAPSNFGFKIIEEDFIHAKMYLVDGKYAVVGSANLTESGLWHNIEHVMYFTRPEEIEPLESDFEHLWEFYEENEIESESYVGLPEFRKHFAHKEKDIEK